MGKIDLKKKPPQPTLTRYSNDKSAFTTGAYIQPVSYIGQNGKRLFGWIVTGFEEDTYRNGEYLEVESCANTLAGLTPDNDDKNEESPEDKIKHLLREYRSDEIKLDTPMKSSSGNITRVTMDGVDVEGGEDTIEFSEINEDDIHNLAHEVEQQIIANEKTYEKCRN